MKIIRLVRHCTWLLLLPLVCIAQPTGNPKGTQSPAADDAAKPSASRNAGGVVNAHPPAAVTQRQSKVARSGNDRTAGVGSTGGLGPDVASKGSSTGK